jgi:Kef-type K+ transport system membrane component KefB
MVLANHFVRGLMEPTFSWKSFVIELALYAVLIVAYFLFVLHYLSGWFKDLFEHDRQLFAVMALVVMIGQAVGLQIVCNTLIWLVRPEKK